MPSSTLKKPRCSLERKHIHLRFPTITERTASKQLRLVEVMPTCRTLGRGVFAFFDAYGGPADRSASEAMRTLSFTERRRILFNVWGLFFAPIYFWYQGMIKRGFGLLGISIIIAAITVLIGMPKRFDIAIYFLNSALFCFTANFSFYLKRRYGLDGWLPTFKVPVSEVIPSSSSYSPSPAVFENGEHRDSANNSFWPKIAVAAVILCVVIGAVFLNWPRQAALSESNQSTGVIDQTPVGNTVVADISDPAEYMSNQISDSSTDPSSPVTSSPEPLANPVEASNEAIIVRGEWVKEYSVNGYITFIDKKTIDDSGITKSVWELNIPTTDRDKKSYFLINKEVNCSTGQDSYRAIYQYYINKLTNTDPATSPSRPPAGSIAADVIVKICGERYKGEKAILDPRTLTQEQLIALTS